MATEVVFLGTGTSSSVPHIDCITAHAIPGSSERPPCRTCLSTIDGSEEGIKNQRRNTSIVLRTTGKAGAVTILMDCGKNFQAAALEWFPKHKLRKIDAVIISHAHSDAMNGLDDLRAWTLNDRIQPHIDIYTAQDTFQEIKRTFPYLVSKEFASGGGDVPQFIWHPIVEDGIPFEILDTGVKITPFLVNHGRLFAPPPAPALSEMSLAQGAVTALDATLANTKLEDRGEEEVIVPYMCMAFRIKDEFVYMADCGAIPDAAWSSLRPSSQSGKKQLPVCILDCLHLRSHSSHFGLEQSILAARQIGASRTYLLGFSHEVAHDEYLTVCDALAGVDVHSDEARKRRGRELTENEEAGLELAGVASTGQLEPIWVRPAHDGLKLLISSDGAVDDNTYG